MIYIYFVIVQVFLVYLARNRAINIKKLSPLGIWLRSRDGTPHPKKINNAYINNPILINVWKYGSTLERRHIYRFQKSKKFSPWDGCSVNNCQLSYDEKDLERADAVLFHLHRMTKEDAKEIALWSRKKRRPSQLWIFLIDESPMHTVIHPEYNGLFNWSMNYRIDSDVPVPYGRTVLQRHDINFHQFNINHIMKNKTKFIAVMGSNCSNGPRSSSNRWEYVKKLFEYLPGQLDIYGRCLNGNITACPGHFGVDCPLLNNYKFYLAFENSNCQEYLTEKVFWNAYSKYSVPVIMGSPKSDCEQLLPPHSYIHVNDFPSPLDLGDYLLMLDLSDNAYLEYHAWRNEFNVLNEHGYFGSISRHYCRVCESLNYNPTEPPKTYWNVEKYWNKNDQCSKDPINSI
ncbi:hypothetical protein PV325_000301 [Microctonus aethiopoides]|nr:hypothetical protein PV325_000301 [Microctonus aethiopoides]